MIQLLLTLLFLTTHLLADDLDPYRWLEHTSSEQIEWLAEQKEKTNLYFTNSPNREAIQMRLQQIANYEKLSLPTRAQNACYYSKQTSQDNKALLVQNINGEEKILINPNALDQEMNLVAFKLSPNEAYLAYGLSIAGSDQHVWHVIDLNEGHELDDVIDHIQFSEVCWDTKSESLYYIRDCKQLYRHRLGTPTSEDQLIYEESQEYLMAELTTVLEGRYALIKERPWVVKHGRYILIDLETTHFSPMELISPSEAEVNFVAELGDKLLFITDEGCCFGKLIAHDLKGIETLIEEQDALLAEVAVVGSSIFCSYYQHGFASLKHYDSNGVFLEELSLPNQGSVSLKSSKQTPYLDFHYFDFTTPPLHFSYNIDTRVLTQEHVPDLSFDPNEYQTEQRWYSSCDGTRIPLFLIHRKDVLPDAYSPVLLYGYGGFGIPVFPQFRLPFFAWVESGGVLAIPSLRGGNEFGKDWYDQGRGHQKQNVFDDCISAAEYLISHRIGSARSLAIFGTSNGGLMSGACLTQRPDLFRAGIVNKGVLDMLRFHLFTIGKYWVCDYGNPENPQDYAYLLSYSPYHQVKTGTHYPSIMVNTADHDDRVVPIHSYKFAAALQEANGSEHPILLRIEEACGHGGNNSLKQEISFCTDMLTFLLRELGHAIK